MKKSTFILLLLLTLTVSYVSQLNGQAFVKRTGGYFWGGQIRWSAYKIFSSLFFNFERGARAEVFHRRQEKIILQRLLSQLHRPRYVLFEVTGYPLATCSAFLETDNPAYYYRFNTFFDTNILKALGGGPQEPYAISAFLGNILFLTRKNLADRLLARTGRQIGSALAGFVISTGHWHILDNIRIDDRWYEIEFMLTGRLHESRIHKMLWDFRFGYKYHQNPLAMDALIFYLRRSHSDWKHVDWGWLRNSEFTTKISFPVERDVFKRPFISRIYFLASKKYPLKFMNYPVLFKLGIGFVWAYLRRFDREVRTFEPVESSKLIWLINPNVEF